MSIGGGGEGGKEGQVEEAEEGTMGLEVSFPAPPLRLLWQWGGGPGMWEGWSCGHRDPGGGINGTTTPEGRVVLCLCP